MGKIYCSYSIRIFIIELNSSKTAIDLIKDSENQIEHKPSFFSNPVYQDKEENKHPNSVAIVKNKLALETKHKSEGLVLKMTKLENDSYVYIILITYLCYFWNIILVYLQSV